MKSNFDFLSKSFCELAKIGELAERYIYSDPNTCMYKIGQFAEILVQHMIAFENINIKKYNVTTHANRIRLLKKFDLLPTEIDNILYRVRVKRNDAVHGYYDSNTEAQILLEHTHTLAVWFMQVYGDYRYKLKEYQKPSNIIQEITTLDQENKQLEAKLLELQSRYDEITASYDKEKAENRKRNSILLSKRLTQSEAETRDLIDEQLRQAGWLTDTINLRFSKGTRPQKGKNMAIAEWPTDSILPSKNTGRGYADYALFIGLKLVGIIEAKKSSKDIVSDIDGQCKSYAIHIKAEHNEYVINQYGEYKVPFLFATNGRKYFEEIKTKSGIWFLDVRDELNNHKPLKSWFSPDNIEQMLEADVNTANESLTRDSADYLRDENGLNLRGYQLDAIEAVEESIITGKSNILLSLATGTGKTRIALALIYKLLKNKRFNRILFLVDRNTLGDQAYEKFEEVKIEDLLSIIEIYDLKDLDDKDFEKDTRIHIATVQSLVRRILYRDETSKDKALTAGDYDCIIVDEAHRGYILDKEMDDEEILYRSQLDYLSKYRQVIEYFDAVKIGLTATPALHTTQIFGKPVFNYSYRQAVIDGYLVDHEPPHIIKTELNTNGIRYKKGETIAIYDPDTNEITNSAELEDDIMFDVETFNKRVITPNFNKTALEEIAKLLDPEGEEKTLVFAVNDDHADMIVEILRDIYEQYGINNKTIRKITGSIEGGNQKRIQQVIRKFKNEKYPKIAVTVDLLTTGVDIPKLTNLVFMRPVKSRILFEQMLGRGTRLCDEINKDHFNIIDAVFVYETLEPVTNMKAVVQNNTVTMDMLIDEFDVVSDNKKQINIDQIIAKLQRKKHAANEDNIQKIMYDTNGKDIDDIIKDIKSDSVKEAIEKIKSYRDTLAYIESLRNDKARLKVYSDKKDSFIELVRGYGDAQKPEDYLESFKAYINDNKDRIPALFAVCNKPTSLTREGLKALRLELDSSNFSEVNLRVAWKNAKNEDIAADIISIIRAIALGIPIQDHEARIRNAVKQVKTKHSFTKMQERWLDRIERTLIADYVLDIEMFESGEYKASGGLKRLNKVFGGELSNIVKEINENLYQVSEG